MEFSPGQCASQSVGVANNLFGLLLQTFLAAQCSISSPEEWPVDYGSTALEKGEKNLFFVEFKDEK